MNLFLFYSSLKSSYQVEPGSERCSELKIYSNSSRFTEKGSELISEEYVFAIPGADEVEGGRGVFIGSGGC